MTSDETILNRQLLDPLSPPAVANLSAAKQALLLEMLKKRTEAAAIPRRPEGARVPAAPGQRVLWVATQMAPENSAYNVPTLRRIRGTFDRGALATAVDRLVERHEALRTVFEETGTELLQRVVDAPRDLLRVHKVDGSNGDVLPRALEVAAASAAHPFDLQRGPVFRAELIELAHDDHLLLLCAHHIVLDGASVGVLLRDLCALYDSVTNGTALLPAPLQFADVTHWAASRRDEASASADREYWQRQLDGADGTVELPDRAATARPARVGRVVHQLDAELARGLTSVAQENGASAFMGLVAVLAAVFARYSRREDVVIGTAYANRDRAEVRDVVGYLASTLPLRLRVSTRMSFAELLAHARATTLDAFTHVAGALDAAEGGGSSRTDAAVPFNTMVVMQEGSSGTLRLGAAELEAMALPLRDPKFDLTLSVIATDAGLRITAEFADGRLEESSVRRVLGHLDVLARAAVRDPSQPVADLALLTDAEAADLVRWSGSASDFPRDRTVPQLFREVVRARGDAVAVTDGDTTLSYGALDARSDEVARALRAAGISSGDLVGVCVRRSSALAAALLGVLKAGGAYVPIDPEYPVDRLRFMLRDSGARVVLTERALAPVVDGLVRESVGDIQREVLLLEDIGPASEGAPSTCEWDVDGGAMAPAYVLYTSGSTGTPKGAVVPHRGIVRLVRNAGYHEFAPTDVVLGFAPLAFDASTFEIWGALLNGARLAFAPADRVGLEEIATFVERNAVTVVLMTAALFHQVVDYLAGAPRGFAPFRTVRAWLAGGDVVSPAHAAAVHDALPHCQVSNAYGPTENSTITCCFAVPRDWPRDVALPIGVPIANTTVHVLDATAQRVPVGIWGELYTGGDGLALGYLGRPELTAERFVEVPRIAAGRMYRTGDRARWRHTSAGVVLEFGGRFDTQVKLRGFRVEPGEVEAALRQCAVLGDVAVTVEHAPGRPDDKRLVAYVVPASGDAATEQGGVAGIRDAVLAYARERLPAYMVPSVVVLNGALPVTAGGKLDRRLLAERAAQQAASSEPGRAPTTSVESIVAVVWAEVLGRPITDTRTDLFTAGGHSLVATRIVARVATLFRSTIPLRVFFAEPTIAGLSSAIVAAEAQPGQAEAIARAVMRLNAMTPEERARRAAARTQS